jgi:SIR2-like domain
VSTNRAVHRPSLDPHVSLALGMTARPGGMAVLAGAGLSVAANVPAAWEVQRILLERAAAAAGDTPDDVFAWWQEKTGAEANYDEVLFASASTPLARKDLLREFFEPTDEERDAGIKVPSPAHHSLARMMRDGLVRIIVTLNFDLLIETALRDVGVEPTVVSTVDGVRGMEPLHAQRNLVWHLHGDYTHPEMLNTPDELRSYDDVVNERLDELLDQYGLVVVGWSATWDPALGAAIARCSSRRYPTYWLNRGELRQEAAELAAARDAVVVAGTADAWLADVADACEAVASRTTDPLTVASTVAAFKRELATGRQAVAAHDRLAREIDRLTELPVLQRTAAGLNAMTYAQRLPVLEGELETWAGLVAAAAYWGDQSTDRWWQQPIAHFGEIPRLDGSTDAIESFTAPAVVALYTAGSAAAAAERWDLACDLLTGIPVPRRYVGGRAPAMAVIGAGTMYPSSPWPSRRLYEYLAPIVGDVVGLSAAATRDGWERFEYLDWLANVDRNNTEGEASRRARPVPYLRVDDDDDHQGSGREVRAVPSLFFAENEAGHDVVLRRLFQNDAGRFEAVVDQADSSISETITRLEWQQLPPGGGILPSGVRYPPVASEAG